MASPMEHPRLVHPKEPREREVDRDARGNRDERKDELAADCSAETSAQQTVDAPRCRAHEERGGEALRESDADRPEVDVSVLLPEKRVEREEGREARRGVRDRDASFMEFPDKREREAEVERHHD